MPEPDFTVGGPDMPLFTNDPDILEHPANEEMMKFDDLASGKM